jgi:XTP/dITP diphosphohydrolase
MNSKQKNRLNLLIATNNTGKLNEFAGLLTSLPVRLLSLKEFENIGEVEETGVTFEENAVLKARGYALRAGMWALADDSGLEVEALGGRPGVYSARYAGRAAGYEQKMAALLNELDETGDAGRRARFVSVIAIADEEGDIKFLAEGICAGTIAGAPRGKNGFGYDPVFIPDGFGQTFGELTPDTKDQISHRARATAKIIRYLHDFTGV